MHNRLIKNHMEFTEENNEWLDTLTGQKVRIKTSGHQTNGQLTIIEYIEAPKTDPPIFTRHAFVESFFVIEGTLSFQFLGEESFVATAGSVTTCPPWKPHSFWNQSHKPVRVLLICTPAGLDEFFIEASALIMQMASDKRTSHEGRLAMKSLRDKYGLQHVGDPPLLKR